MWRALLRGSALASVLTLGCARARQLGPIRLQPIVTLGGNGDSTGIATDPRVSALHPGGFRIVIPGPSGATVQPLVYGEDGRLLGELGGGTGPGDQFGAPLFARFGPGDSIWVFDGDARALVFDANRRFVRAIALPVSPWDAVVLPDDRLVVTSANADQPLPVEYLDATGRVIHAIGAGDSSAAAIRSPRWIVRGADGTIWTMPAQFRWRLEHWDTAGAALGALDRTPAWFPAYAVVAPTTRQQAPQPTVQGAWFDTRGHLWVLGRAAGKRWSSGLGTTAGPPIDIVILDPDKAFDTEFEVLDVGSNRLIASAEFDRSYVSVVEPGVVVRTEQTGAGWRRAQLVRVTLDSSADR